MSRDLWSHDERLERFPRVSGDEPVGSELWASRDRFSPRERG